MRRVRWIALFGTVVIAGIGVSNAQNVATVSVNVSSLGKVIPTDFDGFSIEVDDSANKYLGVASSPNLVFYQLLENLGKSTIRIGGSSEDYSCWNPSQAPQPAGCTFTITQDGLNGFMKASATTGWGLILGVNLAENSGTWALQYGNAAVNAAAAFPGSKLLGFEFGNEPDLYSSETFFDHTNIRPLGYSWPNLVTDWNGYISAFKGSTTTASIPLVGPSYDDSSDVWRNSYLAPFLDGVGPSNLGIATVHEYPTDTCSKKDAKATTIPALLAESLMSSYVFLVTTNKWISNANSRGLPLELDETNSTACGGKVGVDDVMAATAWGVDWLFTNFNLGFSRINFHMDTAAYSAVQIVATPNPNGTVTYANTVKPLYYAMYTFSTKAQGQAVVPTTISTSANIKAYAVRSSNTGPVTVFVINKDLSASGTVSVMPSTAMTTASLLMVQAPSLSSNAVTYGGVTFDNNTGLLTGTPATTPVNPVSGSYSFTLPNASMAVLTINP
jgi:hypothetical protein